MIICHCKAVSDRDIKSAARACDAEDLGTLERRCPAGTVCGGCRPAVEKILSETTSQRREKSPTPPPAIAV